MLKQGVSYLTTVTPDNLLSYKAVEIAGSDGKTLRLISGVQAGDRVALNVGDGIAEGGKVRPIVEDAPVAAKAPTAAPSVVPAAIPATAPAVAPAATPSAVKPSEEAKNP